MALTLEWLHRLERWRNALPQLFYIPLGTIELSGFTTQEQLSADEALRREFRPMPTGTHWGAKWEYGWFKGSFELPPAALGQRIVLRLDLGGEALVYINGQAAGARDREHTEITLTTSGVPGQRYEVLAEAYAGHGPTPTGSGPVPHGQVSVPEPGPTQAVVGSNTFGIWNEEAYQLWLDVETLYHLRNNHDPESLRVAEIDRGLRDFTLIVDLELPYPDILASIRAGRERLRPLLACVNGSTAPTLFLCGHAHLDVAWLWPLAETERKMGRTIANQLALMAEYPEYKYLQSQAHLYTMLRARYPYLYERAKAAAKSGQLVPEGGMWVEADTNISGGESLIRQFLYGKKFFRDEFGVECELLWLPDVFGYSAALPQIMRGCGIKYFATQKIFWTYHGGDPFPYNTFIWQGLDGSEVLAHIFGDYNSHTHPTALIQRWQQRVQKDGISTFLVSFGHGDGGGGPTRHHLEFLRRCVDLEGVPRTRLASPVEFFKDLEARLTSEPYPPRLPRYVGELYLQVHRGTYTSQARTKQNNRRAEIALREAEMWGAAAQALAGFAYPKAELDQAWQTVLLLQFHDILPGSSIHRVYEEAEAMHAAVIQKVQALAREAAGHLVRTDARQPATSALTVFNSLSWPRMALIPLPEGWLAAADAQGRPLPTQAINGQTWAEVSVPSCGCTTVWRQEGHAESSRPEGATCTSQGDVPVLENELLRVVFNRKGEIISMIDKETGQEWTAGPCNSFKMYRDVPSAWDAWDIDSMYEDTPVELDTEAQFEVVASGPLVATIRVTRKLHDSPMMQEISLRRGTRRLDFATRIEWQEDHKLLKVAFPVRVHSEAALHEIQFGHIERPNHRTRLYDATRFEVANHKWTALAEEGRGFAVLNDSKYGVNVLGNSINLTLLKSAMAPDMLADRGTQTFTYACYAWNGCLAESGVVREGYELNCPVLVVPAAGGERSLFAVDAENVVIETVKPAEDGSGDVIVRLYESKRTATRCMLTTTLPVRHAIQTNMLEAPEAELPCNSGQITLAFRPFEIKTIRLQL